MGQEILYCATCQTQIREADFLKQAAYRIEHNPYCFRCALDVLKTLPPGKARAILQKEIEDPPSSSKPVASSTPCRTVR